MSRYNLTYWQNDLRIYPSWILIKVQGGPRWSITNHRLTHSPPMDSWRPPSRRSPPPCGGRCRYSSDESGYNLLKSSQISMNLCFAAFGILGNCYSWNMALTFFIWIEGAKIVCRYSHVAIAMLETPQAQVAVVEEVWDYGVVFSFGAGCGAQVAEPHCVSLSAVQHTGWKWRYQTKNNGGYCHRTETGSVS